MQIMSKHYSLHNKLTGKLLRLISKLFKLVHFADGNPVFQLMLSLHHQRERQGAPLVVFLESQQKIADKKWEKKTISFYLPINSDTKTITVVFTAILCFPCCWRCCCCDCRKGDVFIPCKPRRIFYMFCEKGWWERKERCAVLAGWSGWLAVAVVREGALFLCLCSWWGSPSLYWSRGCKLCHLRKVPSKLLSFHICIVKVDFFYFILIRVYDNWLLTIVDFLQMSPKTTFFYLIAHKKNLVTLSLVLNVSELQLKFSIV